MIAGDPTIAVSECSSRSQRPCLSDCSYAPNKQPCSLSGNSSHFSGFRAGPERIRNSTVPFHRSGARTRLGCLGENPRKTLFRQVEPDDASWYAATVAASTSIRWSFPRFLANHRPWKRGFFSGNPVISGLAARSVLSWPQRFARARSDGTRHSKSVHRLRTLPPVVLYDRPGECAVHCWNIRTTPST